ncbi:sulfatase-like hydrolase/transferase [Couchioplanes azureus]|uniref:sulfatase-like hydrolase/transferase n=1 Tax=Couchioplanes caeruleus TaxID=56438 RepID=UPI001E620C81|nr:sulfatase-like hydrolase/transferase [Couchioplanes caeruleus]
MSVSLRAALLSRLRGPAPAAPASRDVPAEPQQNETPAQPRRLRRIAGRALTAGAVVLIFAALIMPNVVGRLARPGTYVRLPIEGFLAVGIVLLLRGRWKRIAAAAFGAGLGVLTVEKALDMGFNKVLARPFDLVLDWELFDDAYAFVQDSSGRAAAVGALAGIVLLVLAVLVLMTRAALRVAKAAERHRTASARTSLAGIAVWVVLLVLGVQIFEKTPVAARASVTYAWDRVVAVQAGLQDEENFAREVKVDAFAATPPDQLLTGLRGKDLLVTFVESYGRSALEDPALAPGTVKVLEEGAADLAKAGYVAKSGWLTSPTAGGGSWLAHATLLSGLWINNQQRYRNLTASERLTLTSLSKRAGFDTISVMPGAKRAWPEGSFYGYNRVYDSRNTGYAGPRFSWSPQPDQYTLSWFQKNVHGPAHAPMFVEMPLVSSHTPWAPIPSFIDWDDVGDGAIYEQIKKDAKRSGSVWQDAAKVKREYGRSIQYTLTTIISYLEKFGDENTVMVFLGDHQPSSVVVGDGASRDVPITIVTKDKAVLDRVAGWNWTDGIKPAPGAPVWRMDQFRDKFLTAYGPATGVASRALSAPRR